MAVPILLNDTAKEVFDKVLVAAELVLDRTIPLLKAGKAKLTLIDLSKGSYFGGRKEEDGCIDWFQSAKQIHDLVRAVTYSYSRAFSDLEDGRLVV